MNKKISMFISLLIVVCLYPYYKIINTGIESSKFYVMMLMWAPAGVAIITNIIYEHKLPTFGIRKVFSKEVVIAYIIPIISCIVVYGSVYLIGLGKLTSKSTLGIIPNFLIYATFGVVFSCLSATGEELGWRGFLLQEFVKKNSYIKSSWIVGTIWLLYHLPLILFSNYNNGVSILSSVIFFSISVYAVTFIANLLTIRSETVWPAIILHSTHNVLVQGYFDPMTVDTGVTKFITTEFGCGLAIIYTIFAFMLYLNWKSKLIYKQ